MKFVFLSLLVFSMNSYGKTTFGKMNCSKEITPISKLLSDVEQYKNQYVTISGTITNVCKSRGCWMEFASDKKYQILKIKVKDGDMVFPMTARGKKGYACGKLEGHTVSESDRKKMAKHRAEKYGEKLDLNKITGPEAYFQFVPSGVTIE